MTAPTLPSRFGLDGPKVAIAVSIALHAGVLALIGRLDVPSAVAVEDRATPPVVWLGELRARPDVRPPDEEAAPLPETAPAPEAAPTPGSEDAADAPRAETRTAAESEAPPAEPTSPNDAPPSDDIDWEAAKAQAVAAIDAELERRAGRITFSTGDGEGDSDALRPAPGAIFDGPKNPKHRVMSPGRARTRVGRFAAELCNALTGGFGLGNLFSMCSDEEIYATYFAHLKPDYMRKRPLCEEPGSLDPLMAEMSRQNGIPTTKCRLVSVEELEAALAGSGAATDDLGAPLAHR